MNRIIKFRGKRFDNGDFWLWVNIEGKLYCPDCYEYDKETNEYKPKKKLRNDSTGID